MEWTAQTGAGCVGKVLLRVGKAKAHCIFLWNTEVGGGPEPCSDKIFPILLVTEPWQVWLEGEPWEGAHSCIPGHISSWHLPPVQGAANVCALQGKKGQGTQVMPQSQAP